MKGINVIKKSCMRLCTLLCVLFAALLPAAFPVLAAETSQSSQAAPDLGITSPGAILMEAQTGTILYEQGSHTKLRPASVTKIMTILLAYEAVRDGRAHMDDMVTVSKNAAGYGGSTILLEEGEQISLENLIKGM